ncbi:4-carboxy-4-hydroxy-2-oxoadipate aldolase/oxaloacetate decarboxylase [Raoultella terrigena]|uniref:4-carboxy-4-hydroxy-2-oxoadipate aldolase/oxaloacetate decarboxylase n=1 Tax=Raoultella terrigena TaxID=577 RepID=UPI001F5243D4|nr:4-carboxy-4-hydroxy-2-oxoadipate aldolase/oxaloacetate decarboxylase [Raoultella terrigena]MCI1034823.1 4-carboxy-4-hydroxy-2-oxoadipate aldolase/oxaloacetate decarboxylase [Raoultella terrigena]
MFNVLHQRPLVNKEIIEKLRVEDVATVHEAMGRRGAMTNSVRPLADGMKFCGRALTVKCHPADNLMLIKAINMATKDDVLVVDMGDLVNSGPFGEVLALECVVKQVSGLVFSCTVRDSAAIKKLGLPVFSNGRCVEGTVKATLGYINHPISVAGALVYPGDVIMGDDDGVVVIPHADAESALIESVARREKEAVVMNRIKDGESVFDIYSYQKILDRLYCTEESITHD